MLRYVKDLQGFTLHAKNGDIGSVEEFYFDDEKWVVRYLVTNTGSWLSGRLVLISPISIREVDWTGKKVHVNLSREQVEGSPDIDLKKPVSRQKEEEFYKYYAWPYYWGGMGMWGAAMYPSVLLAEQGKGDEDEKIKEKSQEQREKQDSHMRSTKVVLGYHIHAEDGEIGHVDDFLVEDATWAIRYFIVDTRNWLPGKKVILSTKWIDRVVWEESMVHVDLTREDIKEAPEFRPEGTIEREYETRLHGYYAKMPYW